MKLKNVAVVVGMSLLVVACGGNSGGGTGGIGGLPGGFGNSIEAQFIDAPVKGLAFSANSNANGVTKNEGKFECKRGEILEFKIGGLALGKASCGDKIFVQDLISPVVGYSWEKAAAVIQSFSLTENGVLDLSNVTIPASLSALNFNSANFDTDVSAEVALATVPADYTPPVAVPVANAATEANGELNTYATVSSELQSLYTAFGLSRKVYGKLSSGSNHCWNGFTATASIIKTNNVNKFTVSDAILFGDSSSVPDNICSSVAETEGECENVPSDFLPQDRIVTSSNVSLMYTTAEGDSSSLVIVPSLTNGSLGLEGVLKTTFEDSQEECTYLLSAEPYVIVATDDGEISGTGAFQGNLSCLSPGDNVSFLMTVKATIREDASAAEGYVVDLDIKDDENIPLLFQSGIALVNDVGTPDDMPFLQYSFNIDDNGNPVEFSISGYNDWDNDGYFISNLSSDTGVTCSSATLPRI